MAYDLVHVATAATVVGILLIVCMICNAIIKKNNIHWMPESVAQMAVGFVFGLIALAFFGTSKSSLLFNPQIFFFGLLPPIIFEAGYTMKRKNFFKNLTTIVLFAVPGTVCSTLLVGTGLWAISRSDALTTISAFEALQYGALISATDPVATLAVLGSKDVNVDPMLYSIIFGESVLNDAVAITLFESIKKFIDGSRAVDAKEVFIGILEFFEISAISLIIGAAIALLGSFCVKHANIQRFPAIEVVVVVALAYTAYCISSALEMSGVMSLFFSGIFLAHYNWYNLSKDGKRVTRIGLQSLASAADTSVFMYLGVTFACSLYSEFGYVWDWTLIGVVLGLIICARAVQVFLFSACANLGRSRKLTCNMKALMIFSGLRGAIAFALALNLSGPNAPVLITTTLAICLGTTIVCGVLTAKVVAKLGLKGLPPPDVEQTIDFSVDDLGENPPLKSRRPRCFERYCDYLACWHRFDDRVMKPLFGGKLGGHSRDRDRPDNIIVDDLSSMRQPTMKDSRERERERDGQYDSVTGSPGYQSIEQSVRAGE